jgi:hypothetical protein
MGPLLRIIDLGNLGMSVEGGVEGLAAPPMLAKWCLGPIWDRPLPVSRPPGRVGCASAVYPNVA